MQSFADQLPDHKEQHTLHEPYSGGSQRWEETEIRKKLRVKWNIIFSYSCCSWESMLNYIKLTTIERLKWDCTVYHSSVTPLSGFSRCKLAQTTACSRCEPVMSGWQLDPTTASDWDMIFSNIIITSQSYNCWTSSTLDIDNEEILSPPDDEESRAYDWETCWLPGSSTWAWSLPAPPALTLHHRQSERCSTPAPAPPHQ